MARLDRGKRHRHPPPCQGPLWCELGAAECGAARVLGYDDASWNSNGLPINCSTMDARGDWDVLAWRKLTAEQRRAATVLGYDRAVWHASMLDGVDEANDGVEELGPPRSPPNADAAGPAGPGRRR